MGMEGPPRLAPVNTRGAPSFPLPLWERVAEGRVRGDLAAPNSTPHPTLSHKGRGNNGVVNGTIKITGSRARGTQGTATEPLTLPSPTRGEGTTAMVNGTNTITG